MEYHDLRIIDAAEYAFEISIGERYGAVIESIEAIEEGSAMAALERHLATLEAENKSEK